MGYVEKRGKNSWRLVTHVKVGDHQEPVRMTLRLDQDIPESIQRKQAEIELKKLEKRLAGEASEEYTLRQWSEIWLTKHLEMDASPVTVSNYRYLLNSRILPQLGDKTLGDLTPALLTDWLYTLRQQPRKTTRKPDDQLKRPRRPSEKLISPSKQAKPLSVKTVLLYYGCMKTMLAAAVRVGQLEYNPMDRVKHPKKRKKKLTTMSEAEAAHLIQLILNEASQPLKLSVLFALLCGLRLGEVCAITQFDIDYNAGTIQISRALKYTPETGSFIADPKTEAGDRVITLPNFLLMFLREARWTDEDIIVSCYEELGAMIEDGIKPDTDPEILKKTLYNLEHFRYIVHNRLGARVNKDTPSKWFRKFADAHGYQGTTFHDLRHAHASLLVAKGMDIASIAARMSHSDPSVTLSVYTHALAPRDQTAADTLETIVAAALPAVNIKALPPTYIPPEDDTDPNS